MKQYLLTWYGITDLRAALGFEEAGGPVLGALRTGAYTDVIVLAYTDPSKSRPGIAAKQQGCLDRLAAARSQGMTPDRAQATEAVDLHCNTSAAHQLYESWLRGEISKLGLNIEIHICERELSALNDAKGIHDAAIEALDAVTSEPGDKNVTFYLSPGTPVMAFTWAFVSLVNPELDIKVIASSDFRRPPEIIALPYDLMMPSGSPARNVGPRGDTAFDVIFHLFGEQRLPSILGILQFECKRHVFVTSRKYSSRIMRAFMPAGAECDELVVDPFDPMSTQVQLLKAAALLPLGSRVGFNLTGGTKLMFAGASAACRRIGGKPFYFETQDHKLIFLDSFSSMEMQGIRDLEWFFKSNGFAVSESGRWENVPARARRVHITNFLWERKQDIRRIYPDLADLMRAHVGYPTEFDIRRGHVRARLEPNGRGRLEIDGKIVGADGCADFAKYLCGGWLEEYVYLLMEPMLKSGAIRDLRTGLTISWPQVGGAAAGPLAQEFDVCFTDGNRLFIVECKAGDVTNEDVYKLETCVRKYGGVLSKGVLISAFPPHREAPRRRLAEASNLISASGADVLKLLTPSLLAR